LVQNDYGTWKTKNGTNLSAKVASGLGIKTELAAFVHNADTAD
jgi:hypothetical protein